MFGIHGRISEKCRHRDGRVRCARLPATTFPDSAWNKRMLHVRCHDEAGEEAYLLLVWGRMLYKAWDITIRVSTPAFVKRLRRT